MTPANKIIIAALAFAVLTPGLVMGSPKSGGYTVDAYAKTTNFPGWDRLNIRAWPASYSRKVAKIKRYRTVYVERCIYKAGTDWCKISKGWKRGWVNGRYLRAYGYNFASPHPDFSY